MGPQTLEYIETVLTCKGNYYAPDFYHQLSHFKNKLQLLLSPNEESTVKHECHRGQQLILKKVEPWNSVRVTFNVPIEAARRLREMAARRDPLLHDLGILAVQIEGDRVISLTLEGTNSETTELVIGSVGIGSHEITPGLSSAGETSRGRELNYEGHDGCRQVAEDDAALTTLFRPTAAMFAHNSRFHVSKNSSSVASSVGLPSSTCLNASYSLSTDHQQQFKLPLGVATTAPSDMVTSTVTINEHTGVSCSNSLRLLGPTDSRSPLKSNGLPLNTGSPLRPPQPVSCSSPLRFDRPTAVASAADAASAAVSAYTAAYNQQLVRQMMSAISDDRFNLLARNPLEGFHLVPGLSLPSSQHDPSALLGMQKGLWPDWIGGIPPICSSVTTSGQLNIASSSPLLVNLLQSPGAPRNQAGPLPPPPPPYSTGLLYDSTSLESGAVSATMAPSLTTTDCSITTPPQRKRQTRTTKASKQKEISAAALTPNCLPEEVVSAMHDASLLNRVSASLKRAFPVGAVRVGGGVGSCCESGGLLQSFACGSTTPPSAKTLDFDSTVEGVGKRVRRRKQRRKIVNPFTGKLEVVNADQTIVEDVVCSPASSLTTANNNLDIYLDGNNKQQQFVVPHSLQNSSPLPVASSSFPNATFTKLHPIKINSSLSSSVVNVSSAPSGCIQPEMSTSTTNGKVSSLSLEHGSQSVSGLLSCNQVGGCTNSSGEGLSDTGDIGLYRSNNRELMCVSEYNSCGTDNYPDNDILNVFSSNNKSNATASTLINTSSQNMIASSGSTDITVGSFSSASIKNVAVITGDEIVDKLSHIEFLRVMSSRSGTGVDESGVRDLTCSQPANVADLNLYHERLPASDASDVSESDKPTAADFLSRDMLQVSHTENNDTDCSMISDSIDCNSVTEPNRTLDTRRKSSVQQSLPISFSDVSGEITPKMLLGTQNGRVLGTTRVAALDLVKQTSKTIDSAILEHLGTLPSGSIQQLNTGQTPHVMVGMSAATENAVDTETQNKLSFTAICDNVPSDDERPRGSVLSITAASSIHSPSTTVDSLLTAATTSCGDGLIVTTVIESFSDTVSNSQLLSIVDTKQSEIARPYLRLSNDLQQQMSVSTTATTVLSVEDSLASCTTSSSNNFQAGAAISSACNTDSSVSVIDQLASTSFLRYSTVAGLYLPSYCTTSGISTATRFLQSHPVPDKPREYNMGGRVETATATDEVCNNEPFVETLHSLRDSSVMCSKVSVTNRSSVTSDNIVSTHVQGTTNDTHINHCYKPQQCGISFSDSLWTQSNSVTSGSIPRSLSASLATCKSPNNQQKPVFKLTLKSSPQTVEKKTTSADSDLLRYDQCDTDLSPNRKYVTTAADVKVVASNNLLLSAVKRSTGCRSDHDGHFNYRRPKRPGEDISSCYPMKGKGLLTVAQLLEQAEVAQLNQLSAAAVPVKSELSNERPNTVVHAATQNTTVSSGTNQCTEPVQEPQTSVNGLPEKTQQLYMTTDELSPLSLSRSYELASRRLSHIITPSVAYTAAKHVSDCMGTSSALSPLYGLAATTVSDHRDDIPELISPGYHLNLTASIQKAMSGVSHDPSPPESPRPPIVPRGQFSEHASLIIKPASPCGVMPSILTSAAREDDALKGSLVNYLSPCKDLSEQTIDAVKPSPKDSNLSNASNCTGDFLDHIYIKNVSIKQKLPLQVKCSRDNETVAADSNSKVNDSLGVSFSSASSTVSTELSHVIVSESIISSPDIVHVVSAPVSLSTTMSNSSCATISTDQACSSNATSSNGQSACFIALADDHSYSRIAASCAKTYEEAHQSKGPFLPDDDSGMCDVNDMVLREIDDVLLRETDHQSDMPSLSSDEEISIREGFINNKSNSNDLAVDLNVDNVINGLSGVVDQEEIVMLESNLNINNNIESVFDGVLSEREETLIVDDLCAQLAADDDFTTMSDTLLLAHSTASPAIITTPNSIHPITIPASVNSTVLIPVSSKATSLNPSPSIIVSELNPTVVRNSYLSIITSSAAVTKCHANFDSDSVKQSIFNNELNLLTPLTSNDRVDVLAQNEAISSENMSVDQLLSIKSLSPSPNALLEKELPSCEIPRLTFDPDTNARRCLLVGVGNESVSYGILQYGSTNVDTVIDISKKPCDNFELASEKPVQSSNNYRSCITEKVNNCTAGDKTILLSDRNQIDHSPSIENHRTDLLGAACTDLEFNAISCAVNITNNDDSTVCRSVALPDHTNSSRDALVCNMGIVLGTDIITSNNVIDSHSLQPLKDNSDTFLIDYASDTPDVRKDTDLSCTITLFGNDKHVVAEKPTEDEVIPRMRTRSSGRNRSVSGGGRVREDSRRVGRPAKVCESTTVVRRSLDRISLGGAEDSGTSDDASPKLSTRTRLRSETVTEQLQTLQTPKKMSLSQPEHLPRTRDNSGNGSNLSVRTPTVSDEPNVLLNQSTRRSTRVSRQPTTTGTTSVQPKVSSLRRKKDFEETILSTEGTDSEVVTDKRMAHNIDDATDTDRPSIAKRQRTS